MGSITATSLDPHEAPPQEIKDVYKSWTSAKALTPERLEKEVLNTSNLEPTSGDGSISLDSLDTCFEQFLSESSFQTHGKQAEKADLASGRASYKIEKLPGLIILPSLLPPEVQQSLLSVLLHREFSNPINQTNLHLHYNIAYPQDRQSFFTADPSALVHLPKDPNIHKPLSNQAVLEKNLHWATLGGQYDWTKKEYPKEAPPQFPHAIGKLIQGIFPNITPQAAILNVYSPKDKLSLHRDVSEEVDRGLVSISLGCSCLFIIGLKDKISGNVQHETILLRSGDVLYMSGESRYAWHGVPKIIPDTCPEHLQSWPGKEFSNYEGWMEKRRINLNVRQMFE